MGYWHEFEWRKYAQDLIDFDKQFAKLFSGEPRTEENQDGDSQELFLKYGSDIFYAAVDGTHSKGIPSFWRIY